MLTTCSPKHRHDSLYPVPPDAPRDHISFAAAHRTTLLRPSHLLSKYDGQVISPTPPHIRLQPCQALSALLVQTLLIPPSHQTSSDYVFGKCCQPSSNCVYERSGRNSNFLLNKLHGWATHFMDGLGWNGGSIILSLLNIFWWPSHSEPIWQHFQECIEN